MKALIFDVDDTLYDLATPFYRACLEILPNLTQKKLEELFLSSRKYSDVYLDKFFNGEITKSEMFKYRNRDAFIEHNVDITDEQIDKLEELYRKYQNDITISETIHEIFENLNDRWILAILTNGQVEHQLNKIKVLGLDKYIPKENIFVSEALGVSKPHKEAFEKVLNSLNLNPEDTYYIGDSFENDILGSKNARMKPIWFNHRNFSDETDNVLVVKTEDELKELILSL